MNEKDKDRRGMHATQDPPKQDAGDPGEDPRMSEPAGGDGEVRTTAAPIPPPPPENTGRRQ